MLRNFPTLKYDVTLIKRLPLCKCLDKNTDRHIIHRDE